MPDPRLIDPGSIELFQQLPPPRGGFKGYDQPMTQEELQKHLNNAFRKLKDQQAINNDLMDRLNRQIVKNDRNDANVLVIAKTLKRERRWRRAYGVVIGSLVGFIGWAAVHLGPFILKGMAK